MTGPIDSFDAHDGHALTKGSYSCSPTNKSSGILWGEPRFRDYIKAPRAKISSPKMVFLGFEFEQEVDAILAFLKQFAADGKKN